MSYFNDDNETVRQTLERVMREKGMWKEPEVMHTEIGDFHFYNDNNNNASTSESNTCIAPNCLVIHHRINQPIKKAPQGCCSVGWASCTVTQLLHAHRKEVVGIREQIWYVREILTKNAPSKR